MAAGLRMSTSAWDVLALEDLFLAGFCLAVFLAGLELFALDFFDFGGFEYKKNRA